MKTLFKWGYSLVLLLAIACSQPESEIDLSEEPFVADQTKFDQFFEVYKRFLEEIPEGERQKITKFTDALPDLPDRGAVARTGSDNEVNCRCLTTQNYCDAKGKIGECCICWDPRTHEGVCGVFGGVASCRTQLREDVTLPQKPAPSPKVIIYPDRMKSLLGFIEQNELGKSSSQTSADLQAMKDLFAKL